MIPRERIRNFSIVAHIDHGKSTLADRLLEATHTIDKRLMQSQVLDSMDLEREKGITIKARAVRLHYDAADGQTYALNLIDTPGHVDFTYEVSRSLQACEGAVLVVDAAQGIEAQTLANVHLAVQANLVIIPVINKIDLPSADPEMVMTELEETLAIPRDEVILASAKDGTGVDEVLEAIVARVRPPRGDAAAPLQALVFDSHYDPYKGVVAYVRVAAGTLRDHERIRFMATGAESDILELGWFRPGPNPTRRLVAGEVGYVATGLKSIREAQVGDTLTSASTPAPEPLGGYKEPLPLVFAGIYPLRGDDYPLLRDALDKLHLNDAGFVYEPESSAALGFGFRCGFLGLLHMEIVQERLEREFNLDLITTAPGVRYRVTTTDGEVLEVDSPAKMPEPVRIAKIEEPVILATILTSDEYLGGILPLLEEKRGVQKKFEYIASNRVMLTYELPLNEIVLDFYDRLKSVSKGYASLDYHLAGYIESDLVKLDVMVAGEPVDALSIIVHRQNSQARGRALAEKMRQLIPRQLFEVPIQAAIGNKIIARETVKSLGKNVLAKCYGGDITRKRKLLEKQKEGKKRMKRVGKVEIPQEAFLAVLKVNE